MSRIRILLSSLKQWAKTIASHDKYGVSWLELQRLGRLPRNARAQSTILGRTIEIPSAYWYVHTYRDIFQEETYRFHSSSPTPRIIDCGSNIGLSLIYYKTIFPGASIVAFEPDPDTYQILTRNIAAFGFGDIELHNKAVWTTSGMVNFRQDSGLGGRIDKNKSSDEKTITMDAVRLRDFLDEDVSFLKIDVEGAEYEILLDIADRLDKVSNMFIEYHGKPDQPQQLHSILAILQKHGFRYYVDNALPVSKPMLIEQRGKFYDLQVDIHATRG